MMDEQARNPMNVNGPVTEEVASISSALEGIGYDIRDGANEAGEKIAAALRETLISPNESDQNLEAANVVDGLFAVARSLQSIADALHHMERLAHGDLRDQPH
jgi:hypothetical protein